MKTDWRQFVLVFLIGALLGSAVTIQYARSYDPKRNPKKFHQRMMNEFKSKLGLDREQQQKIAVILQETRTKLDALREQTKPRYEEIRRDSKTQIRALLNESQQKKFDALEARREERRQKKRRNL